MHHFLKNISGNFTSLKVAPAVMVLLLSGATAVAQEQLTNPMDVLQVETSLLPNVVSDGAYRYQVEIEVPEYKGLQPNLAFSYNSSNTGVGSQTALMGPGWSLSGFSAIRRIAGGGGVPHFKRELDIFNLDGVDLLACKFGNSQNTYTDPYPEQFRTSQTSASCKAGGNLAALVEDNQKIESKSVTYKGESILNFIVTSPNGTRRTYVPSGVLKDLDPAGYDSAQKNIFFRSNYLLSEVRDTQFISNQVSNFENTARYTYSFQGTSFGLAPRLQRIDYGQGYRVTFTYVNAGSATSTFALGGNATIVGRQFQRLSGVKVSDGSQQIRAYEVSYSQTSDLDRKYVSSIRQFADNYTETDGDISGSALVSHSFSVSNDMAYFNATEYGTTAYPSASFHSKGMIADYDLDGKDEPAFFEYDYTKSNSASLSLPRAYYNFGNNQAPTPSTNWNIAKQMPATTQTIGSSSGNSNSNLGVIFDYDAGLDGIAVPKDTYMLQVLTQRTGSSSASGTFSLKRLTNSTNTAYEWSETVTAGGSCTGGSKGGGPLVGNFIPETGGVPRKELFVWNNIFTITPSAIVPRALMRGALSSYCQTSRDFYNNKYPFEFVVDLNGDGVDEILVGDYFFRFENDTFVRYALANSPIKNLSLSKNVTFGDVNGDGATDAIVHERNDDAGGKLKVALSTGNGFLGATEWISANLVQSNNNDNTQYARNMSADINGDGLADIILHNGYDADSDADTEYKSLSARIYLSTGTGFVRHTRLGGSAFITGFQGIGDFDGDGDLDIIAGSDGYRSVQKSRIFWQNAPKPFQITKVTTPIGGKINVTYGPSRYGQDNQVPGVRQVVKSIRLEGLISGDRETSYAYEGSRYNYLFRRSIGFAKVTETLPSLSNESQTAINIREYGQGMAVAGRILREEERLGSTVYSQTLNTYDNRHLSEGLPFRTRLTRTISGERFGNDLVEKRTEFVTNDYGQIVKKLEYGFAGGRDDRATTYLYYPNTSRYIVNRLAKMVVSRNLNALIGDVSDREYGEFYYYDGAANYNIAPTRGNVTKKLVWSGAGDNSKRLLETLDYDSYGNVFRSTDARGFITRTTFDTRKRFPLSVTNGVGHVSSMTWDTGCQAPLTATDPNGLTTSLIYDKFCRETTRTLPSGQQYRTWYVGFGDGTQQYISQRARSSSATNGSKYSVQRTYFDGFGQTYKTAANGRTSDIVDSKVTVTGFDPRGQVAWSSTPLTWGNSLNNAAENSNRTRFQYDRLGRVIETIYPNNEKNTASYIASNFQAYSGQNTIWPGIETSDGHCYDASSKNTVCGISRTYSDTDGNIIRSAIKVSGSTDVETPAASYRNTDFSYDILGQLLRARDPLGTAFSYTYDPYGNRTQSVDPGLGTWSMLYDASGNLLRQTDAADRKISFTYDGINRPLSKRVNGVGITTSIVNYTYDETYPNRYNIGKLTTENVDDFHIVQSRYLKNGQPDWVSNTLDGRQYTTQFSYTVAGDLLDQRLPKNPGSTTAYWVGQNRFDAANRVTGFGTYIPSVTYDRWGNQTNIDLSTGGKIAQEFDARRGWMFRNQVYDASGLRLDQTRYARSISGRVESQVDQQAEGRLAYEYDYAGRLLTARTTANRPQMDQTFTYDGAGTMRSNSLVGDYTYGAKKQRPYQVNGESLYYDANGNMTRGLGGKLMEYDGENRPLSVTLDGVRTEYRYGAGGVRVMKIDNVGTADETTTAYIGNVEIRNYLEGSSEEIITYPHPNVRLVNGVASYLSRDQLGSVRTILNDTGALAKRTAFRPFGEALEFTSDATEAVETKGWIGERYDAGAGLQYLNARYYDPELGLFIQPDWFEVTAPGVGTNRYSYSLNDPVNLRDPSGNAPDYGYGTPGSYYTGSSGDYVSATESRSDYQVSITTYVDLTYSDSSYDGLSYSARANLASSTDYWARANVTSYGASLPNGPNSASLGYYAGRFGEGAASVPLGVARFWENVGNPDVDAALGRLGAVTGVALDNVLRRPKAMSAILKYSAVYLAENPDRAVSMAARSAGRTTAIGATAAGAAAISGGTGAVPITAGVNYLSQMGNLGYFALEAEARAASLTIGQVVEILTTGSLD